MNVALRTLVVFAVVVVVFFANPAGACEKCVQGMDGQAYCKDANVYSIAEGQLYAECTPERWCYRDAQGQLYCESQCAGVLCFIA